MVWPRWVLADFTLAFRRLHKNKLTTCAAVVSLAFGLGACLSAFQLIDALLLRPLPIKAPDRLYALLRQELSSQGEPASALRDNWPYPLFQQMHAAVAPQATVIANSTVERVEITLRGESEVERANVQYVSGNMFGIFGMRAALGRLFTSTDDRHPVAVLSHDFWLRRFAKDPNAIGRTFRLTNNLTGTRIYQIAGVAPIGFTGTEPGTMGEIFMPISMHWAMPFPDWSPFRIFAHLHPGAPPAAVRDVLRTVLQSYAEQKAGVPKQTLEMEGAAAGISGMQKTYRTSLVTLGGLAGLVLLIACINVANLLAGQAAARSREMAVRLSLGARRWQLGQMVFAEAVLLGCAASALGWGLALWSAPWVLASVHPADTPAHLALGINERSVAFGLALTIVASLLFGFAPALQVSAARPATRLKEPRRWGTALIAIQAMFCFTILFVAGLFVATSDRLQGQAIGFSSERLLHFEIVNPRNLASSIWDQVADRVRAEPGVQSAAYADWPLLDGRSFKMDAISVERRPPSNAAAYFLNVSPGWLYTMRIPLERGRELQSTDESPGAAVVNESFVRQFLGEGNPLGREFAGTSGWMRGYRFQVVGVVSDARYRFLREDKVPVAYTPFRRERSAAGTMQGGTLSVRTLLANPRALAASLRLKIQEAHAEFRVSAIHTQEELIDSQTVRERLLGTLAEFFGFVALVLAGVGLYGVLDGAVHRRKHEIGVRMALGASSSDLVLGITGPILAATGAGSLAGLAFGLASVRYLESLMYQVRPTELALLAAPALMILAAAVVAAFPAVVRATAINSASVLRAE